MRHRQAWLVLVLGCLLGGPSPLRAHGGTYTGPTVPPYNLPSPTPVPPRGATPGQRRPAMQPRGTAGIDLRRWETWWAYNKERHFPSRGLGRFAQRGDGYDEGRRGPNREEIRGQVIPALEAALKNKDKEIRNSAAIALGKVGDLREFPLLEALLADKERSVREAAILGLGLLRAKDAETRLCALASSAEETTRDRGLALCALGLSGGEVALEFLTRKLGVPGRSPLRGRSGIDDLEALRAYAAGLCGRSDLPGVPADHSDPAAGHLQDAIRKSRIRHRQFLPLALVGLAKTSDTSGARTALGALRHRKSEVRASAAIAVGRTLVEPSAKVAAGLADALNRDRDRLTRRLLLISMGQIGGSKIQGYLRREQRHKDRQHRCFAYLASALADDRELIPQFRKALAVEGDHSVAGALAIALGLFQDREALPVFLKLLEEKRNPELREHVCQALILLGDRKASPALTKLLVEARTPGLQAACALALGLLGDETSLKPLLELLPHAGTITVKGAAATGLGRMGDHRALKPLLSFVKDETQQDLSRAFGCIALGILAEKLPSTPPFARFAIDSNYGFDIAILGEVRDLL